MSTIVLLIQAKLNITKLKPGKRSSLSYRDHVGSTNGHYKDNNFQKITRSGTDNQTHNNKEKIHNMTDKLVSVKKNAQKTRTHNTTLNLNHQAIVDM